MKPITNLRLFAGTAGILILSRFAIPINAQTGQASTNYALTIVADLPSPHTVTPQANEAMRTAILAHVEQMKSSAR